MEDILEPPQRTLPRPTMSVALEYLAWYLSRTTMLATIIVAALFIQEPLEHYVNRLSLAKTDKIRLDRESEVVQELGNLGRMVSKALSRLSSVVLLLKEEQWQPQVGRRLRAQLDGSAIECNRLDNAFYEKDYAFPEHIDRYYIKFIAHCLAVIERIRTSIGASTSGNVSPGAALEYARAIARAIEEHEFIERQRLSGTVVAGD